MRGILTYLPLRILIFWSRIIEDSDRTLREAGRLAGRRTLSSCTAFKKRQYESKKNSRICASIQGYNTFGPQIVGSLGKRYLRGTNSVADNNLMKKIWSCGLLILLVGCSVQNPKDTERAMAVASEFITLLYQSNDNVSRAFALTSNNYQVVSNEGMTRTLRDVAGEIVGNYQRHDQGTDVTRLLAPDAPSNGRVIRFNVAYENDPEGQLLVTMIKEGGVWKVMGFNINSPKIAESQARGTLQQPPGGNPTTAT